MKTIVSNNREMNRKDSNTDTGNTNVTNNISDIRRYKRVYKKIAAIALMMCMFVLLAGCSSDEGKSVDNKSSDHKEMQGYLFETNGTSIAIDMAAKDILKSLGNPVDTFEAPSCAFEGVDKTYTYSSFSVTTYQEKGVDYIGSITLKDDTVETKEGLSLYMSKADMETYYGTEYEEKGNMFIYKKDNMKLRIVIENDQITSIDYMNTKLDSNN